MLTTQEKKKYCNILEVGLEANQEEIAKAYKKMALKYHPDRNHNHGKEEWAKQKFIEVGEAYSALLGKKESGSSNRFSSDAEFKKFEEMLKEVERELNETRRGFNEYEENLRRKEEKTRSEAIQSIEENLTLSNVSISELDSSLWSPYSDWKEKLENSVSSDLYDFIGDMKLAINRIKWKKNNDNDSGFRQGNYSHGDYSWKDPQQPKRSEYGDNTSPNFSDRNFSPNNSGWTGENKPFFSTTGDKIARLKDEIKWNKQCLLKIYDESEKQKCRKIIAGLEKELKGLQSTQSNPHGNSNSNSRKDEKIKQLETEIEQLKKDSEKWSNPWQKNEKKGKISEKEKELSELKKSNEDNTNNLNQEELINELINEIERLKKENKKDELTKKVGGLEKVIQQLVKEIQELKTEIKELKEKNQKGELSEYHTYYLNHRESQLKNRESKLEQLKGIVNSNSNSNSNSNDFPVGWVVGSGIVVFGLALLVFLVKRSKNKRKNSK